MKHAMDMNDLMDFISEQGRHGDTMLAHVSPKEAKLLKSGGGSGTINPKTGLPEFFGFKSLTKPLKKAGHALMSPVRWGGDILESTGIPGISDIGAGISDLSRNKTLETLLPLAAAAYATGPAGAGYWGSPATSATTGALTAEQLAAVQAAGAEAGAEATLGITGAAPIAATSATLGAGLGEIGADASLAEGAPAPTFFGPEESQYLLGSQPEVYGPKSALPTYGMGAEAGAGGAIPPNTDGGASSPWDSITGFADKHPYITAGGALMGASALSSANQAGMMKDINKGQQKSYQDYLDMLNPTDVVKRNRYDQLAEGARAQENLAQKKIGDSLAGRGIRGKGKVAPTGDLAELTRKSMNDAYNRIFGTYNVPSAPGPVPYSPSGGQLATANISQAMAQGIPLALLLSKYGVA